MIELFNDKDIIELTIDEGEDALTSFDAVMLVTLKEMLKEYKWNYTIQEHLATCHPTETTSRTMSLSLQNLSLQLINNISKL